MLHYQDSRNRHHLALTTRAAQLEGTHRISPISRSFYRLFDKPVLLCEIWHEFCPRLRHLYAKRCDKRDCTIAVVASDEFGATCLTENLGQPSSQRPVGSSKFSQIRPDSKNFSRIREGGCAKLGEYLSSRPTRLNGTYGDATTDEAVDVEDTRTNT